MNRTKRKGALFALLILLIILAYPLWIVAQPSPAGGGRAVPRLEPFSATGPVKIDETTRSPRKPVIFSAKQGSNYSWLAEVGGAKVGFHEKKTERAGVAFSSDQAELAFFLRGTEGAAAAQIDGDELNFVYAGGKVRYLIRDDRVKEDIILSAVPKENSFVFDYREVGLRREPAGDGGWRYFDRSGRQMFQMLGPTVMDARGRHGAAAIEIKGDRLTLKVDPEFLRSAAYPVAIDPTVISTAASPGTAFPINRKLIKATTGALILLYQSGSGLAYRVSTDTGLSWSNAAMLSASIRPESAAVIDADNNIYAVYSGNGVNNYIFFRKLTYSATDTWTIGPEITVATDTLAGYPAVFREDAGRLWVSYRANNSVTYIKDSTDSGLTWSTGTSLGNSHAAGSSAIVRYKNFPAVVYEENTTTLNWRYFNGSTWSTSETIVAGTDIEDYGFSVVSLNGDRLHLVYGDGAPAPTAIRHIYRNGAVWTAPQAVTTATGSRQPQITTDGKDIWTFYSDYVGVNQYRLVYKAAPGGVWESTPTAVSPSAEKQFNQVWTDENGAWTNETTDAANTNSADVPLFIKKKGVVYVGSGEKFDYVYFQLAAAADVNIGPSWEYWNGSAWAPLTLTENPGYGFTASGQVRFTPPGNWASTSVNGSAGYYYIRATGSVNASTLPVATQITSVKNNQYATTIQKGNDIIAVAWSEGIGGNNNIMFAPFAVSTITLTIDSTFNRDGTPGANAVDFGVTAPYESPFVVSTETAKHAVQLTVGSSLKWDLFAQSAGDLDAGGGRTMPINQLSWRSHETTDSWTSFMAAPDKILAGKTPAVDMILRHDYRLVTTWDDDPGTYSTVITYTVLPSP